MQDEILRYFDEREENFELFANELLKIKDESGAILPFLLNPAQKKFDKLWEETKRAGKKLWFIIYKPRQLGFCGHPDTRILSSDLRWVKLKDVWVGQSLIATDEFARKGRGNGRKMRTAIVEAISTTYQKAYKLIMDDGRELIFTGEHRLLSKRRYATDTLWREVKDFRIGDKIRYITKPWNNESFEDGWFGGMIDGEGSMRYKNRSVEITVSQRESSLFDSLQGYADKKGYHYAIDYDNRKNSDNDTSKFGNKVVKKIVFTRSDEIFQILGQTRPKRFIGLNWWEGKDLPGKCSGIGWGEIVDIQELPVQEMIDLQTSEKTFIAEGFVSHNSTYVQGRIYHHNFFNANQKALTMGHKIDASNNLFEIYNRFYAHFPDQLKPALKKSNEKKISYAKLGSENKVDTAVAGEVGRSDTFQVVHLTEFAFYPDPKTTLAGLMQGSKYAKIFIIETTANGFNEFRNKWVDAINGIGDFIPFFISWLEFPPYSLPLTETGKENLLKDLGKNSQYNEYDGEEDLLISQYGATLEQLAWRRWAIDALCDKDIAIFHQEYPNTWQEGFIASGRPVFNVKTCIHNLEQAKEPIKRGELVPVYDTESPEYQKIMQSERNGYYDLLPVMKGVNFIEDSKGSISIFSEIDVQTNEHYRYAAGCDVAEGLEQGDYSVIKIFDRKTFETCITWHGHCDPDTLAEEQHKLQVYLKEKVYFATERNNHGLTTITNAYKLRVNQYYAQDFNKGYEAGTDIIGYKTTQASKPIAINILNGWIRERLFKDYDKMFWSETLTFVKDERGRMGAQDKAKNPGVKCFDDTVIAQAIAIVCHLWMPSYHVVQPDTRPGWMKKRDNKDKYSVMGI